VLRPKEEAGGEIANKCERERARWVSRVAALRAACHAAPLYCLAFQSAFGLVFSSRYSGLRREGTQCYSLLLEYFVMCAIVTHRAEIIRRRACHGWILKRRGGIEPVTCGDDASFENKKELSRLMRTLTRPGGLTERRWTGGGLHHHKSSQPPESYTERQKGPDSIFFYITN
jgi:hypothetical protein